MEQCTRRAIETKSFMDVSEFFSIVFCFLLTKLFKLCCVRHDNVHVDGMSHLELKHATAIVQNRQLLGQVSRQTENSFDTGI